jgi:DNA polymerase III subunit delta'
VSPGAAAGIRVIGHAAPRAAVLRAARAGSLPASILLHGPPGIGKQQFGLWLCQLVLCDADDARPCGACRNCHLASRLEHPDLHWFFPLPRPKGTAQDRMADALEDLRAQELAARRARPLRPAADSGEATGLYLAQIQTLRRMAFNRPAMARRKVFLIGDAEQLVPQESSPEAANALLKVLEEPPADTTFIVTAADPAALLPTIRSRLLPLRLDPLPEADLKALLGAEHGLDPPHAASLARLARGSLGTALAFLPADRGEPGPLEALRRQAREWLDAALDGRAEVRLGRALGQAPAGARGAFAETLPFLTLWIRDLAAVAAGAEELVCNADDLEWLRGAVSRAPDCLAGAAGAIEAAEAVGTWTQINVNPQLALAWLLRATGERLRGLPAVP